MPFVLAVDYDDTLFKGSFPEKGSPKLDIIEKVKQFKECGAEIVLWTCREGWLLEEAVNRCKDFGIEFDAVNEIVRSQKEFMKQQLEIGNEFSTHKIFANFYLDDRAYNLDFFLKINVKAICDKFNNY